MSKIRNLNDAIDCIDVRKNKKIMRKAYKMLIASALPAAVKAKYMKIKYKKGTSINSHNISRRGKIHMTSATLNLGLTGKAGSAAKRAASKLNHGNFSQGADSI